MADKFGKLPPILAEFMAEYLADKRGILFPVGNIQAQAVDLSTARVKERIEIQGDFLFADSDSTGTGYIRFNNSSMPAMPFRTNTGVYGFPIKEVFITNAAQVGKVLNLWYGYGVRVIPPNQDITTIGSITNPVTPADFTYGSSFLSETALGANTNETIVAPGSNVAGIGVKDFDVHSENASSNARIILLAKSSAPASMLDGDGLGFFNCFSITSAGMTPANIGQAARSLFVSIGKGLYWRNGAFAESIAFRRVLYTL